MNEQIKKLAEQAGIEFTYDPTEMPRVFVEAWGEDLEKFSGLIVAECAQVARNHILQKYPGMEEYDGVVFVEQAIRKHFGVEQ